MKKSRILALILTFAMIATMMVGFASAEGETCTITIDNATVGKDYAAYKVFDVTVDGENTYYTVTPAWKDIIKGSKLFVVNDADNSVTKAIVDGSPVSDANVIDFFNKLTAEGKVTLPTATTSAKASSATVSFTGVPTGYYYVTSTLGSTVTLTKANANATIIDKNQVPSWTPETPSDSFDPKDPDNDQSTLGKFISEDGETWAKKIDSPVNTTNYFKINLLAPKYVGEKEVVTYTITDTFEATEYEIDKSTISVKIDNATPAKGVYVELLEGKMRVTIDVDKANYTTGNVTISYEATLLATASDANDNTADFTWTSVDYNPENPYDTTDSPEPERTNPSDPTSPLVPTTDGTDDNPYVPTEPTPDGGTPDGRTPQEPTTGTPDESKTTAYTYELDLKKTDENGVKLDGAEFELSINNQVLKFTKDADGNYIYDKNGTAKIEAGEVKIMGLDAGSYTLTETKAPTNYEINGNIPTVIIKSRAEGATGAAASVEVEVKNTKIGSTLPSTGGIGTTIFYVIGSVLVIGAVVLFITKKRIDARK